MSAESDVIAAAEARAAALASSDGPRLLELPHEDFRWRPTSGRPMTAREYVRRNTEGDTV